MNNASFTRRLIAYIIDFIFISAILMILAYFMPKSANFNFLTQDMNELTEQAMNREITFEAYSREFAKNLIELDKVSVVYNALSFIILVIYYVVIPIFTKRTLGKQIMRIKIEHVKGKKLNILNTFTRSIIDIGLLYSLITVYLVQIVDYKTYFFTLIIFGIIQFLLVIISIFMILYRRDKRGLQDILSRSNVVLNEVRK